LSEKKKARRRDGGLVKLLSTEEREIGVDPTGAVRILPLSD
jgi:hypothetical protein